VAVFKENMRQLARLADFRGRGMGWLSGYLDFNQVRLV